MFVYIVYFPQVQKREKKKTQKLFTALVRLLKYLHLFNAIIFKHLTQFKIMYYMQLFNIPMRTSLYTTVESRQKNFNKLKRLNTYSRFSDYYVECA